jgi:hypothetical protein
MFYDKLCFQTHLIQCPITRRVRTGTFPPFFVPASAADPDPRWEREFGSSARIYRPSFLENKPKTLVFSQTKRAFWASFRENWVYNFGHWRAKSTHKNKDERNFIFYSSEELEVFFYELKAPVALKSFKKA